MNPSGEVGSLSYSEKPNGDYESVEFSGRIDLSTGVDTSSISHDHCCELLNGLGSSGSLPVSETFEQFRELSRSSKKSINSNGSAWTIISRSFAEYCILGYENLPRTLLLYYTNFISSPEGYFQTVICNSQHYKNTTINHEFHYISWDNPPKQHPRFLGLKDYRRMVLSSRPFARKFKENDRVLDKIDRELLKRTPQGFAFGGWCSENIGINGSDGVCNELEKFGVLSSGAGGRRFQNLLKKLVSGQKYLNKRQCR